MSTLMQTQHKTSIDAYTVHNFSIWIQHKYLENWQNSQNQHNEHNVLISNHRKCEYQWQHTINEQMANLFLKHSNKINSKTNPPSPCVN